ncbi:MAG: hypothetical protein QME70_13795 [Bacillota bacterium]|nr:hypothetical protein [Bacillota bacterium]
MRAAGFDREALRERLEQWRAFNRWEQERGDPSASPDQLVRWYSQAWESSCRYSPGWSLAGVDAEKVARIRRIRQAFCRLGGGSGGSSGAGPGWGHEGSVLMGYRETGRRIQKATAVAWPWAMRRNYWRPYSLILR